MLCAFAKTLSFDSASPIAQRRQWTDGTAASQRTCQRLLCLTLKPCCRLGAAYSLFPSHVGSRPGFTTQCGDSDPLPQADPDLSTPFTRRQRCEVYKPTHTFWLLVCSAIHGEGRRENDVEKRAESSGVGANTAHPPSSALAPPALGLGPPWVTCVQLNHM